MVRLVAPPALPISDTSTGGAPRPKRQRGLALKLLRALLAGGLVLALPLVYMSAMSGQAAEPHASMMPPGAHELPDANAEADRQVRGGSHAKFGVPAFSKNILPNLRKIDEARQAAIKKELAAKERHPAIANDGIALDAEAVEVPADVPQIDVIELRFEDEQSSRVRIRLRPDFSPSSAAFLREAAAAGCVGSAYRNEPNFLLQGRIGCKRGQAKTQVEKGGCPPGTAVDPTRKCPSHDPHCGCHGPFMSRGMVGWAGGSAGPDWFIYTASGTATHWAHDHTVVGEVADEESWAAIARLQALPSSASGGGMRMFTKAVPLNVGSA